MKPPVRVIFAAEEARAAFLNLVSLVWRKNVNELLFELNLVSVQKGTYINATSFGLLRRSSRSRSKSSLLGFARLDRERGQEGLLLAFDVDFFEVTLALGEGEEDESTFIIGDGLLARLSSGRLGRLLEAT